jgi:hypothetical protein
MMNQVHFEDDRNLGRHILVSSRFTQKDERGGAARAIDSTQVKGGRSRASCAWFCYRVFLGSVESLEVIANRHATSCKRPNQYSEADHERYLLSEIVTSTLVQNLATELVGRGIPFSYESVHRE